MKNIARVSVLAIAAVLVLSGCMRFQMNMTLNSDDTVDGSIVMAIQDGTAETLGMTQEQVEEELFASIDPAEFGDNAEVADYAQDDFTDKEITFTDQPIADALGAGEEEFTIVRDGDFFIVSGTIDTGASDADTDQLGMGAEVSLSITFPGEIEDTNGTIDGNTVTWDLLTFTEDVYAKGGATEGGGFPTIVLFILGVIVIGGIAAALFFALRNKPEADAEAGFGDAPATPVVDGAILPVEIAPQGEPLDAAAPAGEAPVVAAPVVDAPVVDEPVLEDPSGDAVAEFQDAPVVEEPVADAPVADAPVVDAPVVDAPVVDAPETDEETK